MATDRDMQAFVVAYEGAWASRVPGAMGALWHPDGVLHHPALVREGRVAEERVYMDTYPCGGGWTRHSRTGPSSTRRHWGRRRWSRARSTPW